MAGEGWPYISVGWAEGCCGEEFVVESTLEKLGSLEPLIEKAICKSLTSNFKGAQRLSSANIWKLTHQLRAEGMACFPSPSPLLLPHSLRGIIHWCFHKGFPQGKPVSVTQYIYIKSQNLQQWNSKTLLSLGIFLQWKPDLFFSDLIHCLWGNFKVRKLIFGLDENLASLNQRGKEPKKRYTRYSEPLLSLTSWSKGLFVPL